MFRSRREFLAGAAGAAAAVGVGPLALPTMAEGKDQNSPQAILALFKSLPGDVAIKIQAPASNGKPEFLVESNSSKQMFVGSAITLAIHGRYVALVVEIDACAWPIKDCG